jgi:hypothetical protein
MHCGAEFDGDQRADDSADVSDADDTTWGGSPDVAERSPDAGIGDRTTTATDVSSPDVGGKANSESESESGDGNGNRNGTGTGTSTMDSVVDGLRRGLGPDGFIDDSLTILVGLVAGVLIGVGALFVAVLVTESAWGVLVGVVVWLVSTVVVSRQRTVLGAFRLACYALAALLVLGPMSAFSPTVGVDGGIGGRLVAFLVGEVAVAIPAGILVLVGVAAGRARPDSVVDDGPGAGAST